MKKVRLDEIQFEPWASTYHVGAKYQGKPFTGIAVQLEEHVYHEYYYKQGRAHGKWYEFSQKTGEVLYEGFFENARMIGVHRIAYEGFKKVIHCDQSGISYIVNVWNPQGILIKNYNKAKKIDEEYYNDGSIYLISKEQKDGRTYRFYYLGKKSLWLVKQVEFDDQKGRFISEFNDALFKQEFNQLNSAFHLIIVEWYMEHLIEKDRRNAFVFIKKCLTHLDPLFQIIAVNHSVHSADKRLIPFLKKLNDKAELWYTGNFGTVGYGSLNVASKKAIRLLKKAANKKL